MPRAYFDGASQNLSWGVGFCSIFVKESYLEIKNGFRARNNNFVVLMDLNITLRFVGEKGI
jgi:hypothetical protein